MFKALGFLLAELPDFSGILLAAVGVALVIYPEPVQSLARHRRCRLGIAVVLVLMGVGGFYSSYRLRVNNDSAQSGLNKKVTELQGSVNQLQGLVTTYGPKLDQIIQHPASEEQREQAIRLKQELNKANTGGHKTTDPLLANATAMAQSLCGLEHQWEDELNDKDRRIKASSLGYADNEARQRYFFHQQINIKYTKQYLEEYAKSASDLRNRLINEVPGTEQVGLNYLNPFGFTTNNGEHYITSIDMKAYCEDLSKLADAYRGKLASIPTRQ